MPDKVQGVLIRLNVRGQEKSLYFIPKAVLDFRFKLLNVPDDLHAKLDSGPPLEDIDIARLGEYGEVDNIAQVGNNGQSRFVAGSI